MKYWLTRRREFRILFSVIIFTVAFYMTGCSVSNVDKKVIRNLKGSYQAEENGIVGSSAYSGYWCFEIGFQGNHFSFYDGEAGNPGFEGEVIQADEKSFTAKVSQENFDELPGNWKVDKKNHITIQYKKSGKQLRLTSNDCTLVMHKK